MKEKKTSSVFISHSSKDVEFVRKLADELKRAGINIWLDDYELHLGEDLYEYIGSAIEKRRTLRSFFPVTRLPFLQMPNKLNEYSLYKKATQSVCCVKS